MRCKHRAWRVISGFTVMGCCLHRLRFGIQPDLLDGIVNTDGGCVPMPVECADYERDG